MSQENVAVVREMLERFLRNDFEAALSAFDPEVEWGWDEPAGRNGLART
jgi:hypothetical protein